MSDRFSPQQLPTADRDLPPNSEGGLRAPPNLGFWGKVWWWFHFLILVKLARLRFIGILVLIGFVIVRWKDLTEYYEHWTRPAGEAHVATADTEYFCPMHPAVVRDNSKDKCPICFMPLSKRKKGDARPEALPPGIVNRVQLSPYRVVLAGIKTWRVDYQPLTKELITVGFVEFNERELKQVAARVKGRLDTLEVNETGVMVDTGQVLASLYSPDLVETVQNLINARDSKNTTLRNIARKRLELWGISKSQIDEILVTGKANTHLKIHSPIHGHVLKKYVKAGQYVEEGAPLYDIVDLSTVWIQGQVYEEDMAFLPFFHTTLKPAEALRKSIPIKATTRAFPGQTFAGQLTFIHPHLDQDTRTVIVRFELPNPGHKLRPGTTATVTLSVPPKRVAILQKTLDEEYVQSHTAELATRLLLGDGLFPDLGAAPVLAAEHAVQTALLHRGLVLAIPETAVIDTGRQRIVYREVGQGEYEGVLVELGPRMVGPEEVSFYPVLRGLAPGELIVTAGSFLIDAETRLNPAAGSIYFGGSSGGKSGPATVSNVRPSTPADEDAKVKTALAKLSAADRRLAEAQGTCAILIGTRLGSMGVPVKLLLKGQPVFLCCGSCLSGAKANPSRTLVRVEELKAKSKSETILDPPPSATSDEEKAVIANLAELSVSDRLLAQQQRFCPKTGERLGSESMGVPWKMLIQGEPVWFCCAGCHPRTAADQAKMLKKARDLKAKQGSLPK